MGPGRKGSSGVCVNSSWKAAQQGGRTGTGEGEAGGAGEGPERHHWHSCEQGGKGSLWKWSLKSSSDGSKDSSRANYRLQRDLH